MMVYCDCYLIADNVSLADGFAKRFWGLMGKKKLEKGEGLLLLKCPRVHGFFMRFPIDVIYLSVDFTVLGMETLRPWSIGKRLKNTAHVLELKAGTANKARIGDKIVCN